MKKMLFLALMAVVAAVMGSCVHNDPVIKAETLSLKGKDPVNVPVDGEVMLNFDITPENYNGETRYEVSDTSMVKILDHTRRTCLLRGLKYGYCQLKVTCNDTLSITISLNVGLYKYTDVVFDEIYMMTPTDEMPSNRYIQYHLRRYRGVEVPKGKDATLTKVIDDSKRFPEDGTWLYRYSEGEDEYGVFKDSVIETRFWLLPTNAYFDGENEFVVKSSFAPIIEFSATYIFDSEYFYTLGNWEIMNDRTQGDTIRKEGVEPRPMPNIIQRSHFDEAAYLRWYEDYITPGDSVKWTDYNIFRQGDARIKACFTDGVDYSKHYWMPVAALVNQGYFYFDFIGWINAVSYDFEVTYYFNEWFDGLATERVVDPATGEEVEQVIVPYRMADTFSYNYIKTRNKKAPRNMRNDEQMPISRERVERQMKVMGTLGAVLRMAMR